MTEIISKVREFLDSNEFKYDYDEERQSFTFGLKMQNGNTQVRIVCREDEDYMLIFAFWEGHVPVKNVPSVYPVLNSINFNTRFTTVTVDPEDGEVGCHCGINTDQSELSVDQVGISLQVTVRTLDDNIEQIMRAAWNTPANADGKLN